MSHVCELGCRSMSGERIKSVLALSNRNCMHVNVCMCVWTSAASVCLSQCVCTHERIKGVTCVCDCVCAQAQFLSNWIRQYPWWSSMYGYYSQTAEITSWMSNGGQGKGCHWLTKQMQTSLIAGGKDKNLKSRVAGFHCYFSQVWTLTCPNGPTAK